MQIIIYRCETVRYIPNTYVCLRKGREGLSTRVYNNHSPHRYHYHYYN